MVLESFDFCLYWWIEYPSVNGSFSGSVKAGWFGWVPPFCIFGVLSLFLPFQTKKKIEQLQVQLVYTRVCMYQIGICWKPYRQMDIRTLIILPQGATKMLAYCNRPTWLSYSRLAKRGSHLSLFLSPPFKSLRVAIRPRHLCRFNGRKDRLRQSYCAVCCCIASCTFIKPCFHLVWDAEGMQDMKTQTANGRDNTERQSTWKT